MDTAATCKYYVTKLLGISPPKPNCVYEVRSGNVRDREQKSLFRVFYRSNGKRRKRHRRANTMESYAPSMHADEAGAKLGDGDGQHVLEDDTVEEIEKKFQGFRNVFEKCKVKKKKPRLFNVSSGLRFTLVANTMLLDGQKKGNEAAARNGAEESATIAEHDNEDDGDDDDVDDGEEEDEEGEDTAYEGAAGARTDAVDNDLNDEAVSESKCPKDVADKVNSWIDSSVKRSNEYSAEESLFVDEEVNIID